MTCSDIKKSGCRFTVTGDRLIIEGIPDWKTYRYCVENIDTLMLVAVTEGVFKTHDPPVQVKFSEPLSRCAHCKWINRKQCPYGLLSHKIPAKLFQDGCNRWKENKAIYF